MKKPKICLLFAGGTIGMVPNKRTGVLEPTSNPSQLLERFPELNKIIDLEFHHVFNIDSSNMEPTHWTTLAEKIQELYSKYDGFVIAQGTDTMAYTASALSFALQNLSKPVVLTGSLIPLFEIGADALNNLTYACLTATLDIAEVCIVFANRVIRGNRAKKHHESFVDVFHSPNFPYLGELGRPTTLFEWRKKRRKRILVFKPNFNPNIALVKLFPGIKAEFFDRIFESKVDGIIIEGFGAGNLPFLENSVISKVKEATDKGIAVVVANQLEKGITNLHAYEGGFRARKAGAIASKDMTIEACVAKLMWALAQTKSIPDVKRLFEKEIAGELDSNI